MNVRPAGGRAGYTLVELIIAMSVLAIVAVSVLQLFITLANSSAVTKRKALAATLATNQMEYLKSLPYNSLAVAGGSIYSATPLPASFNKTYNGFTYTVKTDISYIDDAYDGCGSYPSQQLKQTYCRNYPPPSNAPALDTNPADYKILHVAVYDAQNTKMAEVDTEVSARVAETSSTTGALFVKVIDNNGNPISGANVTVTDPTLSPAVNLSDSTDGNGIAIFYNLPPDTKGYDYNVTASMSGYSSLTTIPPFGSLQPTYSNLNIFTQQSSFVTLTLKPMGPSSLLIEATDMSGNPLPNVQVYIKGGYKKYTNTTDTQYYYDNTTPTDTRPTSDANGMIGVTNLVPGDYIFCGDKGTTSCNSTSGTNYYLAAAVPYGGTSVFNPITVPTYSAASPPSTTFAYNGTNYYQKVRLMFSTNQSSPSIFSLSPYNASLSTDANNFAFTITGSNLQCGQSSCATSVHFAQGANTYTANCTGNGSSTMNCTVNLSGASVGSTQLTLSNNSGTVTVPATLTLGGILVSQ